MQKKICSNVENYGSTFYVSIFKIYTSLVCRKFLLRNFLKAMSLPDVFDRATPGLQIKNQFIPQGMSDKLILYLQARQPHVFLCSQTSVAVTVTKQPKTPHTCCKLSFLPACGNLSTSCNNLSKLSSCNTLLRSGLLQLVETSLLN